MSIFSPPHPSYMGDCFTVRIILGNASDEKSIFLSDQFKIYLHERGKFEFFAERDETPDGLKIDSRKLRHVQCLYFDPSSKSLYQEAF